MKKIEMTQGNILKKILLFTIPLIIGNFFQLLYNTVDMIIVGQFCGTEAVDSIGAAIPVFNVLSFLVIGLCNGMNILMSEFYGAKKMDTLKKEIGICLDLISIITIVLSIICIIFAPNILIAMQIKSELLNDAVIYLRITIAGLLFSGIYNVYSAALRSIGDSVRPLYFLIISTVLNITFDILFVYIFNLGVLGVALATTIAQFLAMVTCIIYGMKTSSLFHFQLEDFKIEKGLLINTLAYSLASAMQQIVLQVGKALIQVNINALPLKEQAGYNFGTKIDDYVLTPAICIGNSVAVFLAQNRGAGKRDRYKKGFLIGMAMELIYTISIAIVISILKLPLLQLFTKDAEIYPFGIAYLSVMCFLYVLPGLTNGEQSYFRGLGKLYIVFLSSFVQIIFRVIAAYILIPKYGVSGGAWCTLVGWIAMLSFETPILLYYWFKNKGLILKSDKENYDKYESKS